MDGAGSDHAACDLGEALDFALEPDQLQICTRERAGENKRRENSSGRGKRQRFGHPEKTKITLPRAPFFDGAGLDCR
jgi:hypothetical protein